MEFWSKGNEDKARQKMEDCISIRQGLLEVDNERANIWKCGMRWAVEPRRKERGEEQEQRRQEEQEQRRQQEQGQTAAREQGKQVRFNQEEQLEEKKTEGTDEPEVTGRLAEMRTGRGSAGLVRGREDRCQTDETSRKGKGKGTGEKGERGRSWKQRNTAGRGLRDG